MSSVVRPYLVLKLGAEHLTCFVKCFIFLKLHPAGCLSAKQNGEVQGGVHLMKITICDRNLICYELKRLICRRKDLGIQTVMNG